MRVTQYLFICVVIIAMLTGIVSAVTPEYGTAIVDGWPYDNEWVDDNSYLLGTNVCRPMTFGPSIVAQECIRYDCNKKTAYVFLWDEFDTPTPLLDVFTDQSKAFIDGNEQYSSPFIDDSTTPNFKYWSSDGYSAWGYEASFPLERPGSYSFYTQAGFLTGTATQFTVSTAPETLTVTCNGVTPAPEFPSAFLPAAMIIGFLGAVLLIQRTREH